MKLNPETVEEQLMRMIPGAFAQTSMATNSHDIEIYSTETVEIDTTHSLEKKNLNQSSSLIRNREQKVGKNCKGKENTDLVSTKTVSIINLI